jgi:proteasome activator subunit 4
MKTSRFVKLRTFSHGPEDLALEINHNPLKRDLQVLQPTHSFTTKFLHQFKGPLDLDKAREEPYGPLYAFVTNY